MQFKKFLCVNQIYMALHCLHFVLPVSKRNLPTRVLLTLDFWEGHLHFFLHILHLPLKDWWETRLCGKSLCCLWSWSKCWVGDVKYGLLLWMLFCCMLFWWMLFYWMFFLINHSLAVCFSSECFSTVCFLINYCLAVHMLFWQMLFGWFLLHAFLLHDFLLNAFLVLNFFCCMLFCWMIFWCMFFYWMIFWCMLFCGMLFCCMLFCSMLFLLYVFLLNPFCWMLFWYRISSYGLLFFVGSSTVFTKITKFHFHKSVPGAGIILGRALYEELQSVFFCCMFSVEWFCWFLFCSTIKPILSIFRVENVQVEEAIGKIVSILSFMTQEYVKNTTFCKQTCVGRWSKNGLFR